MESGIRQKQLFPQTMKNHKIFKITAVSILFLFFLGKNASFAQTDEDLIDAIIKKDEKKVYTYLKLGVNPNSKSFDGVTPLMYAAEKGNIYIVKQLLKFGAEVNAVPNSFITALIAASKNNYPDIAELLLQNNANVNAIDINGNSSLSYAASFGYPQLAWLLCSYGAKTETLEKDQSPMIISAFYGDNDIIKILLEFAADVNVTDDFGFTPLIIAAQKGHLETVKLLVENGANLEIKNDQKLNALKMAVYKGNADIVEYLLENGAYVNEKEKGLVSVFSIAENKGNAEILSLLKEKSSIGNKYKIPNKHAYGLNMDFGFFDFMAGPVYTYTFSKYNVDLTATFTTRLYRKKILIQESENLFYQYREHRSNVGMSVQKRFALLTNGFVQRGIFVGLGEYYSFGGYSGLQTGFSEFVTIPEIGLYLQNSNLRMNISDLDGGIYFYSLSVNGEVYSTKKLIVR